MIFEAPGDPNAAELILSLSKRHSTGRPRLPGLEPTLCLRRLTDPRTPTLPLQAPAGLRPGWGLSVSSTQWTTDRNLAQRTRPHY